MTALAAGARRPWPALSTWHWAGLSILWLIALSWWRPYTVPDEGRYAGVAWDMLRSASHVVPLLDGLPYFHKPPLYYWLTEASFQLFGVSPWAARLPSCLAAWVTLIAVYAFVRHWRSERAARLSAGVLATQPFFYGGAQFANLDMLVAAMIALTILAGAHALLRAQAGQSHRGAALAMGVAAGLAVLAKGLIGVVLPGITLLLWLVWRRRLRDIPVLLAIPVVAVFLVVTLPWLVAMQWQYSGFFHYFFVYQHFERFAQAGFNNAQPFWFYLPVVAGLILPWSLWLGAVFRGAFWRDSDPIGYRPLLVIWIVVVLGFFSLPASKLIGYVLPVLPALAMLVAEVIDRHWKAELSFPVRKVWRASLAVAALLCVVGVAIAALNPRKSAMPLAKQIVAAIEPSDQFVTLHSYPFDLPLYLRLSKPIWVVDDWDSPDIPMRDTWRKELYDAGQFDPAKGKEVLVHTTALTERLCGRAPATYWLWGQAADGQHYPVLQGEAPYATGAARTVWRLRTDAAFRSRHCEQTPIAG